jgi:hypothetical protein
LELLDDIGLVVRVAAIDGHNSLAVRFTPAFRQIADVWLDVKVGSMELPAAPGHEHLAILQLKGEGDDWQRST